MIPVSGFPDLGILRIFILTVFGKKIGIIVINPSATLLSSRATFFRCYDNSVGENNTVVSAYTLFLY